MLRENRSPINFVERSREENHAFDLMTPCILDRYAADGLVYGLSPARSGDMSIRGNGGIDKATARRQCFLNMVSEKFGYEEGSLRADRAVYMLPKFGVPLSLDTSVVEERKIIPGPESIVTSKPNLLIMQPKDCLPIFLHDPTKLRPYAFCHGGYRSADLDILPKTLSLMRDKFESSPENITVYIGPGIGSGWFGRRYLITRHPDCWRDSIGTMKPGDRVVRRDLKTSMGLTIFFPKSNIVLDKFCIANNISRLKYITALVDAIDYLLSKAGGGVSQLSVSLQRVLVSQAISWGVKPENLEVDPADTFQNSLRGLLFSHQGEYRNRSTVRGNPIAIFGRL